MLNLTLTKSAYHKARTELGNFGKIMRVDPNTGDTDICINNVTGFKLVMTPDIGNILLRANNKCCELEISEIIFLMYH